METERPPQLAERKRSITRRILSVFFGILLLGWPFLLAIPNPLLEGDSWIGILLAWYMAMFVEMLLPSRPRVVNLRTIVGDIAAALLESLSLRGPRS